jgi:phosphate-selective porin
VAQVRAGKFKIPFSLDEMSGEAELDFVYRSLGANYLAPGRDVGGEVHGRVFKRRLNYWAGVFQGDGDNTRTSKIEGADTTVAARLTVTPFARRSALEFGGSWTESDLANDSFYPNGLRGRTVMSQYVFFEPVYVNGHRRRLGADVEWSAGPFGARSEYMFVGDTRDGQGLGNEDLVDARGQAWYALGTWVVTGENKRRPVQPRHGGLFRGGFGAVEVAARYDRLWFESEDGGEPPSRTTRAVTIYPNGDRLLTLGVNYYVNRWMKLQLNAIREGTDDIERSPTPDGSSFWSQVLRLQLEL